MLVRSSSFTRSRRIICVTLWYCLTYTQMYIEFTYLLTIDDYLKTTDLSIFESFSLSQISNNHLFLNSRLVSYLLNWNCTNNIDLSHITAFDRSIMAENETTTTLIDPHGNVILECTNDDDSKSQLLVSSKVLTLASLCLKRFSTRGSKNL